MSTLVVGAAASHSPQVSTSDEFWSVHGSRDLTKTYPLGPDQQASYGDLLVKAPDLSTELTPEVFRAKAARVDAAIAKVAAAVTEAAPEVVIVIGDDQKELFREELIAPFATFSGERLIDYPLSAERKANLPPGMREASWAWHADEEDAYPVDGELADEIVAAVVASDFDIARATVQTPGRSLGHAFTFPKRRLFPSLAVPIVPIFINTYYPPNQPSPLRCFRLGQAVGSAVRASTRQERVAVVATGGLSHFIVDEAFDRRLLEVLANPVEEEIAQLRVADMLAGTSEALNWITLAGIVHGDLAVDYSEYVPGYRTRGGTGVGLAFALWHAATSVGGGR